MAGFVPGRIGGMLPLLYLIFSLASLAACGFLQVRAESSSITSANSGSPASATASAALTTVTGTSDADLLPSTASYMPVSTTLGASPTAQPTYPPIPDGDQCTNEIAITSPFPPFCKPLNGSEKYPNERYYVTWDASAFDDNTTVTIYLNYVNVAPNAGSNTWQSPEVDAAQSFVILETDSAWLQGQKTNPLNITLVANSRMNGVKQYQGPVVSLTKSPTNHLPPSPHTSSNKLGVFIGIPIGVAAFCLIVGGLFYGMKKHREINLKDIMVRRKGYTGRKSRRHGLGRTGPIKILEREVGRSDSDYKDDVELQQGNSSHNRDPSLGSLVESPVRGGFTDNFSTHGGGNDAFRNEIERQRNERAGK